MSTERPIPGSDRPARASSRATRLALTGGSLISAACFTVALLLESLAADLGMIGDPRGWATLGTLAVIVTPACGLLATLVEFRQVHDRRSVGLAAVVLGVLALSVVVALSGKLAA